MCASVSVCEFVCVHVHACVCVREREGVRVLYISSAVRVVYISHIYVKYIYVKYISHIYVKCEIYSTRTADEIYVFTHV